jgi:hypothetical protein
LRRPADGLLLERTRAHELCMGWTFVLQATLLQLRA